MTQLLKLIINYTSRHEKYIDAKLEFISYEEIMFLIKQEPLPVLISQIIYLPEKEALLVKDLVRLDSETELVRL